MLILVYCKYSYIICTIVYHSAFLLVYYFFYVSLIPPARILFSMRSFIVLKSAFYNKRNTASKDDQLYLRKTRTKKKLGLEKQDERKKKKFIEDYILGIMNNKK